MRKEHAQAIALLKRLDADPEIKTRVVLDVMATFEAIFSADRRDEGSFVAEFAGMLTDPPTDHDNREDFTILADGEAVWPNDEEES